MLWWCEKVIDLGAHARGVCEKCGNTSLRYVHVMRSETGEKLLVGSVCADRLCGEEGAGKKREEFLRQPWRRDALGNWVLNAANGRVTVFRSGSGWAASLFGGQTVTRVHGQALADEDSAKLAAMQLLEENAK